MEILKSGLEKIQLLKQFGSQHPFLLLFGTIGGLYILNKTAKFSKLCYSYLLRTKQNLKTIYGGEWALITGATGGLGHAYAQELAEMGYSLILMGRNPDKLKDLSDFLKRKYLVQTKCIVFDFAKPDNYSNLQNELQEFDIGILINNVGVTLFSPFHQLSMEEIQMMVDVNIFSHTFLSRIVIPQMLGRTGKSAILNVSSVGSEGKIPYMNLYSGSKAYIDALTRSLALEFKNNIDFLCIRPGAMISQMNPAKIFYSITTQEAASRHLRFLGKETECFGHWKHWLQFHVFFKCKSEHFLKKRGEFLMKQQQH